MTLCTIPWKWQELQGSYPVAEWQKERSENMSNKEEAVGKKVQYEVSHPDQIFYVDELVI